MRSLRKAGSPWSSALRSPSGCWLSPWRPGDRPTPQPRQAHYESNATVRARSSASLPARTAAMTIAVSIQTQIPPSVCKKQAADGGRRRPGLAGSDGTSVSIQGSEENEVGTRRRDAHHRRDGRSRRPSWTRSFANLGKRRQRHQRGLVRRCFRPFRCASAGTPLIAWTEFASGLADDLFHGAGSTSVPSGVGRRRQARPAGRDSRRCLLGEPVDGSHECPGFGPRAQPRGV